MIFNEAAYLQFKSIFRNSICLSLIVKSQSNVKFHAQATSGRLCWDRTYDLPITSQTRYIIRELLTIQR